MPSPNIAHEKIGAFLDKRFSGQVDVHPFWHLEPFSVEKRDPSVYEQAKKDGIQLDDAEMVRHVGLDPHPFQDGYMLSTAQFRALLAAGQAGKSYPALMEIAIMVSGEKPLSLRFPKGYDTKVMRAITIPNIRRFGRFDSSSGAYIDRDETASMPKTWDEWNCGTIKGVGVYPDEKICPPGGVIWIGTTHKALWEMWWPKLSDTVHSIFPSEFRDTKHGVGGLSKGEWTIHCIRDTRITIISYESDPKSFEAITTHACVFDEEAAQKACVTAAINHTKYFSMVMTPYNGMTYTKKMIFNDDKDVKNNVVFHATSYDSPYLSAADIKHRRSLMESWEIGARIWGLHTEVKGKPYYDRQKINAWIRRFKTPYKIGRFLPSAEFDGIITRPERGKPGLMSTKVHQDDCDRENECDTWRIYEPLNKTCAYYLMADSAEGSDIPSEAGDVLASLVMRFPDKSKNEKFPQMVASLRSTMKTANFARVCSYALRYYNNALLCAEGPARGSYNALFYAELSEYPYWFQQTTLRDSTRKARSTPGFDTNAATRGAIFDGIREVLDEYDESEQPEIRDESVLIELSGCIINASKGKSRPDHSDSSTLDSSVCFGQALYIWRHYPKQVKNRMPKEEDEGFVSRFINFYNIKDTTKKNPVWLGEGIETLR